MHRHGRLPLSGRRPKVLRFDGLTNRQNMIERYTISRDFKMTAYNISTMDVKQLRGGPSIEDLNRALPALGLGNR